MRITPVMIRFYVRLKWNLIIITTITIKSSRRERLTPVLSHHRTYGSVYGGSIKIIDASLYITSVNSCSLYASGHSTLQEVSHGIHRFLPRVRYYVFCVHHDALNAKGYSLLIEIGR